MYSLQINVSIIKRRLALSVVWKDLPFPFSKQNKVCNSGLCISWANGCPSWLMVGRTTVSLASRKSFSRSISWLLSSSLPSWWCISGKVTEKSPEHEINTEHKQQQRVIWLSSATEGNTAGNIEIVHQWLRVGQCGPTSNHRGAEHQLRPKAAFFLLVLG